MAETHQIVMDPVGDGDTTQISCQRIAGSSSTSTGARRLTAGSAVQIDPEPPLIEGCVNGRGNQLAAKTELGSIYG
jgi:hypothetical protein